MLTDEDLTRQLRDAMGDEGAELRYGGRVPRVRRTPATALVTVPAVAAVGAAVIVAGTHGSNPASPAPHGGQAAPSDTRPSPSQTPRAQHRMVTDTISVAGYTFRISHPRGQATPGSDIYADLSPGPLPSDAQPVTDVPTGFKAWLTTVDGDKQALFVETPAGNRFALVSATLSADQLSHFYVSSPQPVPAVS